MEKVYTRRKDNSKGKKVTIDAKLYDIANEFLKVNPDGVFAISKKFVLKADGGLGIVVNEEPCIITDINIKNLVIPSCFRLRKGKYLTTWCDNEYIAQIECKDIIFEDGNINDKDIKDFYLKIK